MRRGLIVMTLMLSLSAACSSDATSTTFTLVQLSDEEAWQLTLERYAEQHGVSLDAAEEILSGNAEYAEAADFFRSTTPGYSGFKIVHEGTETRGVLAVTNPSEVAVLSELDIDMISARIAEADFLAYDSMLRGALATDGFAGIVGVMYDPFEDEFIVWVPERVDQYTSVQLDEMAVSVLEELGPSFFGVGIRFGHSEGRLAIRLETDDEEP